MILFRLFAQTVTNGQKCGTKLGKTTKQLQIASFNTGADILAKVNFENLCGKGFFRSQDSSPLQQFVDTVETPVECYRRTAYTV